MNKLIKELIEQCTAQEFSDCTGGFETFDKEKFAKLIIEECAKVLESISNAPDMQKYAQAIRARGEE